MMMMYFHFSVSDMILFRQWMPKTEFEMTASCFALFVLAILLEFIKTYRISLQQNYCASLCHTEKTPISLIQEEQQSISDKGKFIV